MVNIITIYLTPWSKEISGKLRGPKKKKKFPAFAQRFNTTFIRTCHLPLS
jgi:hypothetical protein